MSVTVDPPTSFPVTERNRLRRRHDRGQYDTATVYPILDAAMLCHVAYVLDGQPYCTPTAFWREDDTLYWHGSSASRMLRTQARGVDVCLTVSHIDGLVMARSGFNHSVNYRSVMTFGRARLIDDAEQKLAAMNAFIDRFFPGRAAMLRPPTDSEVKATSIMSMRIEQASAKIRTGTPHDDEPDYEHPIWAGVIPLAMVIGEAENCPRLMEDTPRGPDLAAYRMGERADAVFAGMQAEAARSDGGRY